jgi:hypothetical protein
MRTPGDGRMKNLTPALSMASRMRRGGTSEEIPPAPLPPIM